MSEAISKRDLLLRSLIGRYEAVRQGARFGELKAAFTKEESDRLSLAPAVEIDSQSLSLGVGSLLEAIHSSWVSLLVAAESPPLQGVICGALPPRLRRCLTEKGVASDGIEEVVPSGEVSRALLGRLYRRLGVEGIIPQPLLPPSPLNELLTLDQPLLVRVIGVLGLYEIAALLRRQILPAVHKSVLRLLTEGEISQLKGSLQQQDILPPPKIDLIQWTSSRRRFYHLLQLRGLMRFRYCLTTAHPSLVWHLAHRLDVARGRTLFGAPQREVTLELERRLVEQLLGVVHQLKEAAL